MSNQTPSTQKICEHINLVDLSNKQVLHEFIHELKTNREAEINNHNTHHKALLYDLQDQPIWNNPEYIYIQDICNCTEINIRTGLYKIMTEFLTKIEEKLQHKRHLDSQRLDFNISDTSTSSSSKH